MSTVEDRLVGIARSETPKVLGGVAQRLADAIDGDGGSESEAARFARRRYHGSRSLADMLNVDALYDPESADIHDKAIEAELERDYRADDDRTLSQRRADAVTNLFRQSLDRGEVGTSRGALPHVTYVVHLDGDSATASLARIQCDCDITRIVMTGASEIFRVGRATQTVSAAQWKALVVRDRHCQAPGCNQPPERCQAHHLRHWTTAAAPTSENLKLYCWHHHREQHRHDAQARAG